jgi:hypothetical protein
MDWVMDKGMEEFNSHAETMSRLTSEWQEVVKLKIVDVERTYNDMRDLQVRIRTECHIEVSLPSNQPPEMPSRFRRAAVSG